MVFDKEKMDVLPLPVCSMDCTQLQREVQMSLLHLLPNLKSDRHTRYPEINAQLTKWTTK